MLLVGTGAGAPTSYTLATKQVNELVKAAEERQLAKTIARSGRVRRARRRVLSALTCIKSFPLGLAHGGGHASGRARPAASWTVQRPALPPDDHQHPAQPAVDPSRMSGSWCTSR